MARQNSLARADVAAFNASLKYQKQEPTSHSAKFDFYASPYAGHPAAYRAEPAHAEAFYGLAHREQTVGDIMRQVARNGADPPALLREGERVRSPSLLDLATNLLNRRTQED